MAGGGGGGGGGCKVKWERGKNKEVEVCVSHYWTKAVLFILFLIHQSSPSRETGCYLSGIFVCLFVLYVTPVIPPHDTAAHCSLCSRSKSVLLSFFLISALFYFSSLSFCYCSRWFSSLILIPPLNVHLVFVFFYIS